MNRIAALVALLSLTACFDSDDGRLALVDLECSDGACSARWDGSDARSTVFEASEIEARPAVDPAAMWECDVDPDVDLCVTVDDHDHVGCFRVQGDLAVAVAPTCAVEGDAWIFVGVGMSSLTL